MPARDVEAKARPCKPSRIPVKLAKGRRFTPLKPRRYAVCLRLHINKPSFLQASSQEASERWTKCEVEENRNHASSDGL